MTSDLEEYIAWCRRLAGWLRWPSAERDKWLTCAEEAEHYLTLREAAEELGLATLDGGD